MQPWIWVALGGLVVTNVVAWAAFRIDKARAKRGVRRISERRLLTLAAAFGAGGALIGMYAHRRRHKVDKRRFRAVVWLCAVWQVGALGFGIWWLMR